MTTPAGTGISVTDFTVTVAALGGHSSEIADAGSGVSEGTPLDPAKEPGVASGSSLVSIGAEVNSEEVHGSQIGMRLTQVALDQKRLSVERVASLAFPFASGRASAVDLSLRNVRLLGGNWPMSGDSGSPTRLMSGPATRPEEVSGDGAATASVAIRPKAVTSVGRRYSFYSPEMNLLAESEIRTDAGAPAILYEYVWFNGHPVAQVDGGTTTHWTFTDHLGTPIIQTPVPGRWETNEKPMRKHDHFLSRIPDSSCECIEKRLSHPGNPPPYCALGFPLPLPPSPPHCSNCQDWVNSVLQGCGLAPLHAGR